MCMGHPVYRVQGDFVQLINAPNYFLPTNHRDPEKRPMTLAEILFRQAMTNDTMVLSVRWTKQTVIPWLQKNGFFNAQHFALFDNTFFAHLLWKSKTYLRTLKKEQIANMRENKTDRSPLGSTKKTSNNWDNWSSSSFDDHDNSMNTFDQTQGSYSQKTSSDNRQEEGKRVVSKARRVFLFIVFLAAFILSGVIHRVTRMEEADDFKVQVRMQ